MMRDAKPLREPSTCARCQIENVKKNTHFESRMVARSDAASDNTAVGWGVYAWGQSHEYHESAVVFAIIGKMP